MSETFLLLCDGIDGSCSMKSSRLGHFSASDKDVVCFHQSGSYRLQLVNYLAPLSACFVEEMEVQGLLRVYLGSMIGHLSVQKLRLGEEEEEFWKDRTTG